LDATLNALAALDSTAGLLTQTALNTLVRRTLAGAANEITVTNGDGVAGAPTLSLPATLNFAGKAVTGGLWNKVTITTPATGATLTLIDGTVLTGPAASGTVIKLGNTESVTGVKTFGSAGAVGRLKIAGSTSGSTVLDATAIASGTIQLPAASGIVVLKDTTDILINKTLDSAGTGNVLKVSGVTVSAGQYPGETTTGNATAGNVGEYVNSDVPSGSAVSLVTATAKTVTSISLPAGDWDVQGKVGFGGNAATTVTRQVASLSATNNTLDNTNDRITRTVLSGTPFATDDTSLLTPTSRFQVASPGPATVFLVAFSAFGVNTATAYGEIRARRVR
jgi:hypothetical protein